jgi:hypothetical protein
VTVEEPLPGGNIGRVVRVGATVRRTVGPWTPAVHELLLHLERVGFPFAPRVLGFDDRGREILSFIEGETVGDHHPWPPWAWTAETLVQVGRIMKEYHEAVRTFRPTGVRTWRFATAALGDDDVICHNDIAPYNIVYREGRVVGIIDWDLAAPGLPAWDLAFSATAFAPVHSAEHARALGAPADVAARIKLLCDSYGLVERSRFVGLMEQRLRSAVSGIEARAEAGDEPFRDLITGGHVQRMRNDIELIVTHSEAWQASLDGAADST